MDKAYWLERKRASMVAAQNARSPGVRSVHYELAARYDASARHAEAQAKYLANTVMTALPAVPSPRFTRVADNA